MKHEIICYQKPLKLHGLKKACSATKEASAEFPVYIYCDMSYGTFGILKSSIRTHEEALIHNWVYIETKSYVSMEEIIDILQKAVETNERIYKLR